MQNSQSSSEFVRPAKKEFVRINAGTDGTGRLLTAGWVTSSQQDKIELDNGSKYYLRTKRYRGEQACIKKADAAETVRVLIADLQVAQTRITALERQIAAATNQFSDGIRTLNGRAKPGATATPQPLADFRFPWKRAI